jgi:hypothetical protein
LNFCVLWKKQTTSPSLAYAGIPYHVLGDRVGALALMMAWSRSARTRSGSAISAIFASTSLSPSALLDPRRPGVFTSRARSLTAARSSSVNPLDAWPRAGLADCCAAFIVGFLSVIRSDERYPARQLDDETPQQKVTTGARTSGHGTSRSPFLCADSSYLTR